VQHSAALAAHQSLLARLRAEEAERLAVLEAELKAKTTTFSSLQHRETTLEEEQIHFTQTAAQMHREVSTRRLHTNTEQDCMSQAH
jgi:K+/H+ antiporter YhaU regulatory subunit KhtT